MIPVGGAIACPQADAAWRGVLCPRTVASAVSGMIEGILEAVPSVLTPETLTLDSPHMSLVHSAFPLMNPG